MRKMRIKFLTIRFPVAQLSARHLWKNLSASPCAWGSLVAAGIRAVRVSFVRGSHDMNNAFLHARKLTGTSHIVSCT
jgi:hypothetical protein